MPAAGWTPDTAGGSGAGGWAVAKTANARVHRPTVSRLRRIAEPPCPSLEMNRTGMLTRVAGATQSEVQIPRAGVIPRLGWAKPQAASLARGRGGRRGLGLGSLRRRGLLAGPQDVLYLHPDVRLGVALEPPV